MTSYMGPDFYKELKRVFALPRQEPETVSFILRYPDGSIESTYVCKRNQITEDDFKYCEAMTNSTFSFWEWVDANV